ncbi:MAG: tyrosine-protein phosphatase [Paracoccaceae bacterium]
MLTRFWTWLDGGDRGLHPAPGGAREGARRRLADRLHYLLVDHALLRLVWSNSFEIAPGVHRSNQPTHARFRAYRDRGIRTVINLRGKSDRAHYRFESASCAALGLELIDTRLWARRTVSRERILEVIETMRRAERPFIFHCKSGADRAGFAAAIYLMVFEGVPVQQARRQLGLRYIHLKFTRTGVLDYLLRVYQARNARAPIPFEDWIRTEYEHRAIQQGFDSRRPPEELA